MKADRMTCYILKDKTPVLEPDDQEWARWFVRADRIVAKTMLPGKIEVSTMFLGMDHGFDSREPLLFETMIFGGPHDGYQHRHPRWKEAEIGHEYAVKIAKGMISRND